MSLTPQKPVEASFRLESIWVLFANGLVPVYEGKEREIGNEVTNDNSSRFCQQQPLEDTQLTLTQEKTGRSVQY